jgi:hypothetical protein
MGDSAFEDETLLLDTNLSWNDLQWSLRKDFLLIECSNEIPHGSNARKQRRSATLRKGAALRTIHIDMISTTVGLTRPKPQAEESDITGTSKANTTRRVSREGGTSSAASAVTTISWAAVVTTYRKLAWASTWYLREDTLKDAVAAMVNFHHALPLSAAWGGGTLSSSDGQRFAVDVKARNARAIPRYFGYGRGVTHYSWTGDQYSQYGTKVIPSTVRDATHVLDGILGNETDLPIGEHTVDTHGFTEIVFALFAALGLRFSPRIRDLSDQLLYRVEGVGSADGPRAEAFVRDLLRGKVYEKLILRHWDDILRVGRAR